MNTDIESQLQSAFGARAALLTEHDLTPKPDIALALIGALPQRRGFMLAGIAAAVVLATVGGGVAIAASTGSGHSGTPAGGTPGTPGGQGGQVPASIVFSTAANGPETPIPTPTPSCTAPSICYATTSAAAPSTSANAPDPAGVTTPPNYVCAAPGDCGVPSTSAGRWPSTSPAN